MKTQLLKFFLASCLVFFGGQNVNAAVAVTLGAATTTGLATSTSLTYNQTGVGILGFSVAVSGGSSTFSSFQFSATQTIGTYFSNVKLYSNTTNSFTSATQVTGISVSSLSSTTLTISGLSQVINSATKYYFIVADYAVASSTSASFQLSLTSVTGTTSKTSTVSGITYTLSAQTCDWIGTTSTAWTTTSNWQNGRVPGTYDAVNIAVNYSPTSTNSIPVISASTTIGSLTFGGSFTSGGVNFPGISVSSGITLTVIGDINIITDANPGSYTYNGGTLPTNQFQITGAGTLQATNMYINANYGSLAAQSTQQAVVSSIANLILTGNMVLTSENYFSFFSLYNQYASFYLNSGTTEIDGGIQTSNTVSGTSTYPTSTLQINPSSSAGATLKLGGATALSGLSSSGTNVIDVNNTYATVNYSGTGQTVYTSTTANVSGSMAYYNLTLSGGTQTPATGTLTVANDFKTTATAAKLNTNNTVLTVSDISYINGGTMTLGSGTFTTSNGLDIYSNAVFNAGSGNIVDGNFFRVNNDLGSATVNFSTGTTTIANAVQLYGGTVNGGSGPISVASSTQIFTGATLNAGTGSTSSLTFTGSYQNSSGGTFTAGGGSVYFNSSYSNSGTFSAGSGTVYFNFAGAQSLSDASAAGTTFKNVNFQNSGTKTMSGTGGFAVSSSGVLTMAGTATLAAGGVLTLKSDATGSATVAAIPTGTSITGNVNVERFITGGGLLKYRDYRLFSSPVYASSQTLGASTGNVYNLKYLNTSNTSYPITTGASGGGFDKVGNPTIYLYREDRAANNNVFSGGNFIGVSNITGTTLSYNTFNNTTTSGYLPVGNGFFFFYRGSKASLTGRTTLPITSTYYPDNTTVTQVGTLNQGNVPVILWYNSSTANSYQSTLSLTSGNKGFNLVGNPYASSIDWSTFNSSSPVANSPIYGTNVATTIYEYDPAQVNIYGSYNSLTNTALNNGNKIIASGQGFFVKATAAGATLKFTEAAKSTTQLASGSTLLMGTPVANSAYGQYLKLNISKDTTSKFEVLIGFNSKLNNNYNEDTDDLYFNGQNPAQSMSLYSADKVRLVSKWLAFPKAKLADTVKINVRASASGQYKITRSDLKSIPNLYQIWLMDNYKKDSLDIKHNADYVFDLNLADTNSYGARRFQVIIRQDPLLGMRLLNFAGTKTEKGSQIVWKTENEENYTNFTVERSTDNGKTFDVLGGFASSAEGTYSFLDKNPPAAADQYRLKLVDLDGTITYSKVVTLMYSNLSNNIASNVIGIYPNPTKGIINISIAPSTLPFANTDNYSFNIIITGSNGTVVKKAVSTQLEWQDNVANLLPGSYVVQVINNQDKTLVGKTKFIKL